MRHFLLFIVVFCYPLFLAASETTIRVGSKNFTEQVILGEIIVQLLKEETSHQVERQFNLAGTKFTFEALKHGDIDVYVEYTGTGLVNILDFATQTDPQKVYQTVQHEFRSRFGITWLLPLGFNNTYALAIRNEEQLNEVNSISDLTRFDSELTFGAPHEFLERSDGYPKLQEVYGIEFGATTALEPGIMYQALQEGEVDVISAFSTDGRIEAFDLKTLKDDKQQFPPYYAVPVIRSEVLENHPDIGMTLNRLGEAIDEETIMRMNYLVDSEGQDPRQVAQNFLVDSGLLLNTEKLELADSKGNFIVYAWLKRHEIWRLTNEHLWLVMIAMGFAILLAIPLGVVLTRFQKLRTPMFAVINTLQTIPSLALLGFMIPLFGIGVTPAIIALFLYALLPLVRNTFTGILDVDPDLREAARGMGLTDFQILRKIEVPLALPVIMAGIRTSTVIVVGTATLAALIGAGGYGDPIFRGIASVNSQQILLGALPAALLAIVLDRILHFSENRLVSKGLQSRRR